MAPRIRIGSRRWAHGAGNAALLLALGAMAPTVLADGGIDLGTRLDALEARLDALTRRVAGLESAAKESRAAGAPQGAPAWIFDDYVRGSPFLVGLHDMDPGTGQVDLLLELKDPLPDPDRWADVVQGGPVPLAISAESADARPGAAADPIPLVLERATRIAPGSRIHVTARLDPEAARRSIRIRVGRAEYAGSTRFAPATPRAAATMPHNAHSTDAGRTAP